MCKEITLSPLGKTWIFDLDGTLVKHNGYKDEGHDTLLAGVKTFFENIPNDDLVVIITARKRETAAQTEEFLRQNGIRFDTIIYNAPYGERILVNDAKPSGLQMAIAVNTERDHFMEERFTVDPKL